MEEVEEEMAVLSLDGDEATAWEGKREEQKGGMMQRMQEEGRREEAGGTRHPRRSKRDRGYLWTWCAAWI